MRAQRDEYEAKSAYPSFSVHLLGPHLFSLTFAFNPPNTFLCLPSCLIESTVASQVNELNIIRQSLYDLETQHGKIRQHYEEEIARARAESRANVTGGIASLGSVVGPGGPPGAGPLGGLGGGAGAGPSTSGPGGLSGAPGSMYNSDPYYPRQERDRDRMERERERDRLDRERLERDRDIRERDSKRLRADKIALKPERPGQSS